MSRTWEQEAAARQAAKDYVYDMQLDPRYSQQTADAIDRKSVV